MKIGIPVKLNRLIDKLFFHRKKCIKVGEGNYYYIYPKALGKKSVVYSGGAAANISFELDLYKKFNAKVSLFDPSPIAIDYIKKLGKIPLKFYPLGISEKSGFIYFQDPYQGSYGSYPTSKGLEKNKFRCVALSDIIKKNKKIDLLKLDIEGSEYGVINDILKNKINVSQICVEFHHFIKEIPYRYTMNAIRKLRKAGYVLIYKDVDNFTFIKKDLLNKK